MNRPGFDYVAHLKRKMTQEEIDQALMAKMEADEKEIERLRAEIASLQDYAKGEVAECDALRRKLHALAPHGTCGCAWDSPDDLCMHHSPEVMRLRTMLQDLVQQLESKNRGKVDAPGHSHNIPGVWDNDNGELAGKPCAWCALWREAKAMVQSHNLI